MIKLCGYNSVITNLNEQLQIQRKKSIEEEHLQILCMLTESLATPCSSRKD